MKKYQTKPEVVEACQFTGTKKSFNDLRDWLGEVFYYDYQESPRVFLRKLIGPVGVIGVGTWIVKQLDIVESHEAGKDVFEFIVMRDDQFQNMYTCYCDCQ